jgi:hypothetical protein
MEDRTLLSPLTVSNNQDSGSGSLRATISAATSGATINFSSKLAGQTITLTSGPLTLGVNLTIDGLGASQLAISGDNASRILDVNNNALVAINGLTFEDGLSSLGGAILNETGSSLQVSDAVFTNNQAAGDTNGNALGGAIANGAGASLSLISTLLANNQTNGTNESFGGAIDNAGSLSLDHSSFIGNQAVGSTTPYFNSPGGGSLGGAIHNDYGSTLVVAQSTFSGNQALGSGTGDAMAGAICNGESYVYPFAGPGITATVSQCTFLNNTSTGGSMATDGGTGGAIEALPGVTLTLTQSTFAGNQANTGGGVIASGGAFDDSQDDTVTIANCGFYNNSATAASAGGFDAYGGAVDNVWTMTIANSVFIGNKIVGPPNASPAILGEEANSGGAILTGLQGFSPGATVSLTISNSLIAGNEAIAGPGTATTGVPLNGAVYGGGIANYNGGTLNVLNCKVIGNQAIGGASSSGIGGFAFGGGIANSLGCILNVQNSIVGSNVSQGGAGSIGYAGGAGVGGGIDSDTGSTATIGNTSISLNQALGGTGGAGANGGAGVGGGLATGGADFALGQADASSTTISNCLILTNLAQGGTGGSGGASNGDGFGGGAFAGGGTLAVDHTTITLNTADGGSSGAGIGGGVYIYIDASVTLFPTTQVKRNHATTGNNDIFGVFST